MYQSTSERNLRCLRSALAAVVVAATLLVPLMFAPNDASAASFQRTARLTCNLPQGQAAQVIFAWTEGGSIKGDVEEFECKKNSIDQRVITQPKNANDWHVEMWIINQNTLGELADQECNGNFTAGTRPTITCDVGASPGQDFIVSDSVGGVAELPGRSREAAGYLGDGNGNRALASGTVVVAVLAVGAVFGLSLLGRTRQA